MEFLDKLKQLTVTKAWVKNGRIFVILSGYKIPSKKVKIVANEPSVGSNYYGGKRIFIDKGIAQNDRFVLSIAVHEAVEDWLKKHFFPNEPMEKVYKMIHDVAEHIEKKFHVERWGLGSWNKYMTEVDKVWEEKRSG